MHCRSPDHVAQPPGGVRAVLAFASIEQVEPTLRFQYTESTTLAGGLNRGLRLALFVLTEIGLMWVLRVRGKIRGTIRAELL